MRTRNTNTNRPTDWPSETASDNTNNNNNNKSHMNITIRPERIEDHDAIHDLTHRAFATMPYAHGDEPDLIGRFRRAGVLTLSLVAVNETGVVIGQVTFTPAFPAEDKICGAATTATAAAAAAAAPPCDGGWYALGPVAVEPDWQRQGIGGQLIRAGIAWLQERNAAAGCILVGDPAYYGRFGFVACPASAPLSQHVPAEFFQILSLRGDCAMPNGVVEFHPLFFVEQ
jgi:putative acetyltransferase